MMQGLSRRDLMIVGAGALASTGVGAAEPAGDGARLRALLERSAAADAARAFHPHIVYPFHYIDGEENTIFANELAGEDIDVRLRDWYEGD